jgi:hypothetical protein
MRPKAISLQSLDCVCYFVRRPFKFREFFDEFEDAMKILFLTLAYLYCVH